MPDRRASSWRSRTLRQAARELALADDDQLHVASATTVALTLFEEREFTEPATWSWGRDLAALGDPDYVVWHCILGATESSCRAQREADSGPARAAHAYSGYRIVLPLPDPESR